MTEGLKVNPATSVDHVGHTGIYPASGPWPAGNPPVRGQGELAHPEERARRNTTPSVALLVLGTLMLLGLAVAVTLSDGPGSSDRA